MMQNILIYGNSIALAGLAARLTQLPDVRVFFAESLSELGDLTACHCLLIDLNDTKAVDFLAILRARPALPVIGVNFEANTATVFTSQVYLAHSIEDIIRCLKERQDKVAPT